MHKASTILIVGFGDVGERLLRLIPSRCRVYALVRSSKRAQEAHRQHAIPLRGDLASPRGLGSLTGLADTVFHFAPPPALGDKDVHTRNLLDALTPKRAAMLPQRLIYISTTGVYGGRDGGWVDESSPLKPATDRARRRVDAERILRKWGQMYGVDVTILRAPGIYAADRLPIDRLRRGLPALMPADDVFTNHIHADDLAQAAWVAAFQGRGVRAFNVVDDSDMKMGDYFDRVADHFGLPRAPRVSREEAGKRLPVAMLSFMNESRRIRNDRLKRELRFRFRYPTVGDFLRSLPKN